MRNRFLCGLVILSASCAFSKEEGPNSSDATIIVEWFFARDSDFYQHRKAPAAEQKKFKDALVAELAALPDAAALERHLKKHTILLKWVTQYIEYANFTKKGKYSPAETELVQKMSADLKNIPSKAQLQLAGFEVCEATEALLAGKIKIGTFCLTKRYERKLKAPTAEDEAALMAELFAKK
ncbi:MAG TPA: hypothetical protein VEK08_01890 [Planctomycetota bacterium]|nr:hypothetical protein [Planctomycetota bacterium]